MKKLIERWREMADRYENKADNETYLYVAERLSVASETLRLCADHLERALENENEM